MNAGNDTNDEKDIELGAAEGFKYEGEDFPLWDVTNEDDMPQEDVSLLKDGVIGENHDDYGTLLHDDDVLLLNMKVRDVVILENHEDDDDDDVTLLIDADDTGDDHYDDNNQGNMEGNVHIS